MARMTKQEREEAMKNARNLFIKKGMDQAEIASLVGVSKTTINSWSTKEKWMQQRQVANLTPERLQSEVMEEINKVMQAGKDLDLSGVKNSDDVEELTLKLKEAIANFNKERIKTLKDLYNIYADIAKSKGDLAQHIQGFQNVALDLISQNRISEAKEFNLLCDEYIKKSL